MLLAGFWSAGLVLTLLWFNTARVFDWRFGLAAALVLIAGGVAWYSWKNSPNGQLAWDGQGWRWESASYQSGVAGQNVLVLADFQRVILVRLENQAHASLWLLLEQQAMPERWMDLRRALYSPCKQSSQAALHASANT